MENENNSNIKKIKPFIGAAIVLFLLLLVYFFVWRNIAYKTRDIVSRGAGNYSDNSEIKVGGFPFKKTITINDVVFKNSNPLFSSNQVLIGKVEVESFIFSRSLVLSVNNVRIVSPQSKATYNIEFNEKPTISLSFYSNNRLNEFNYLDKGYRVVDGGNTLYTAGETSIKIESVRSENIIDYVIAGSLRDMQNISVLNEKQVTDTVPDLFTMNFDASSSINKDDEGNQLENIFKMSSAILYRNSEKLLEVDTDITTTGNNAYTTGSINIVLENYKELLDAYKNETVLTIKNNDTGTRLTKKEIEGYITLVGKIFDKANGLIEKNPRTVKDKQAVLTLRREKGSPIFYINDVNLQSFISDIMLLRP
jgi:hypothetical protein